MTHLVNQSDSNRVGSKPVYRKLNVIVEVHNQPQPLVHNNQIVLKERDAHREQIGKVLQERQIFPITKYGVQRAHSMGIVNEIISPNGSCWMASLTRHPSSLDKALGLFELFCRIMPDLRYLQQPNLSQNENTTQEAHNSPKQQLQKRKDIFKLLNNY